VSLSGAWNAIATPTASPLPGSDSVPKTISRSGRWKCSPYNSFQNERWGLVG
jgi:hypothetical protein